jgi:hypothetical protein
MPTRCASRRFSTELFRRWLRRLSALPNRRLERSNYTQLIPMFPKKSQDSTLGAKRAARIRALRSEYHAFLYAPIGKSDEDVSLSVLSALARQNIDAWEEAATLTHLSRESAIARLASIISPMTTEQSDTAQAQTAARLVALLPQSDIFNLPLYI